MATFIDKNDICLNDNASAKRFLSAVNEAKLKNGQTSMQSNLPQSDKILMFPEANMAGHAVVRLQNLINAIGEAKTYAILSAFSCPSPEVQDFIRTKAIAYSLHDLSQTYLVFTIDEEIPILAAYFTLVHKLITIPSRKLNIITKLHLSKYALYARDCRSFLIPAPFIAYISKNHTNRYCDLITGTKLLDCALKEASRMQRFLDDSFVIAECNNLPNLYTFYSRNGFVVFDRKKHDKTDTFVKMIKYIQ